MTNEEIRAAIAELVGILGEGQVDFRDPWDAIRRARRQIDAIGAALEANPPLEAPVLAEVEGWVIDPGVWREARDVSLWNTAEEAEIEECEDGAILVTVTIRGKGDVPEPPATPSSIR